LSARLGTSAAQVRQTHRKRKRGTANLCLSRGPTLDSDALWLLINWGGLHFVELKWEFKPLPQIFSFVHELQRSSCKNNDYLPSHLT